MPGHAPAVRPAITVTKLADNLTGTAVSPTLAARSPWQPGHGYQPGVVEHPADRGPRGYQAR